MDKEKDTLKQQKFHLKAMVSTKQVEEVTDEDMALINKHTRRELTADEVYIYPIVLCDNEVDRDYEYFTKKDLEILADLFIGKTFIQDHSWTSGNQHSRIFKTEVVKVPGKTVEGETKLKGKPYYQLKAWAYTVKNGHEDLIENIEAGILKEVSVGFSIKDLECDICGNSFYDGSNCSHWPGRSYKVNGKDMICHLHMKDPKEAYEVSFVAVPAQPAAGVVKGVKLEKDTLSKDNVNKHKHEKNSGEKPSIFYAKMSKRGEISLKYLKGLIKKAKAEKADVIEIPVSDLEKDLEIYDEAIAKAEDAEKELKELKPKAAMGDQYVEDLKKECTRLGKMAEGESFNEEMMGKVFEKCDVEELKEFKKQYESKVDEKFPPAPQAKNYNKDDKSTKSVDNSCFK
ncbi:XkdF-like putative serine protease domain-containing protein [Tissierella praeacuta]|uniref:XkdF-like putative serine protease domain-containing protein n=1 Tax=Tissierella praeacuta TaxID=43131 RepID=UPI00333FA27E